MGCFLVQILILILKIASDGESSNGSATHLRTALAILASVTQGTHVQLESTMIHIFFRVTASQVEAFLSFCKWGMYFFFCSFIYDLTFGYIEA